MFYNILRHVGRHCVWLTHKIQLHILCYMLRYEFMQHLYIIYHHVPHLSNIILLLAQRRKLSSATPAIFYKVQTIKWSIGVAKWKKLCWVPLVRE